MHACQQCCHWRQAIICTKNQGWDCGGRKGAGQAETKAGPENSVFASIGTSGLYGWKKKKSFLHHEWEQIKVESWKFRNHAQNASQKLFFLFKIPESWNLAVAWKALPRLHFSVELGFFCLTAGKGRAMSAATGGGRGGGRSGWNRSWYTPSEKGKSSFLFIYFFITCMKKK